jgi:oligopeptide transport system substrate-binding protein
MKAICFVFCLLLASVYFIGCQQIQKNESHRENKQIVRISIAEDPQTLDPRKARNVPTVTILHMLYEGLMRPSGSGPLPGLAKEVKISNDLTKYTFRLRESYWSNGDPLTAEDFIRTWRKILDPSFPAPNAYQFYMIKGAKEAKLGQLPVEEISLTSPDPLTLVVQLEAPTPYFLDLLTTHFFYPYHSHSSDVNTISNGPFRLEQWTHNNELILNKNPFFWDHGQVHLKGIEVLVLDDHTALTMYDRHELDWAGSPMGTLPQDAILPLKLQHRLHIRPAAGTHWFRFNTEKSPFSNLAMRKAFALALNRKDIVEHVTQGNQRPALSIVPPGLGLKDNAFIEDHAVTEAWKAYQEALEALKISKDEFPKITLCYANSERNHKIAQAVQQQWKKALDVDIELKNCESQVFNEQLQKHEYLIASGSWYADFKDPINFLEVFKYKDTPTNNTQWENKRYIELLNLSSKEADPEKRKALLLEAETILMHDMPVAPLFFGAFNYLKKESLLGTYFSELGFIDFTYAFFGE